MPFDSAIKALARATTIFVVFLLFLLVLNRLAEMSFRSVPLVFAFNAICPSIHGVGITAGELDIEKFGQFLRGPARFVAGLVSALASSSFCYIANIVNRNVVLVELSYSIYPVLEVLRSSDLIEVMKHPNREFGCQQGKGWLGVPVVSCFLCKGLELGQESVHLVLVPG